MLRAGAWRPKASVDVPDPEIVDVDVVPIARYEPVNDCEK